MRDWLIELLGGYSAEDYDIQKRLTEQCQRDLDAAGANVKGLKTLRGMLKEQKETIRDEKDELIARIESLNEYMDSLPSNEWEDFKSKTIHSQLLVILEMAKLSTLQPSERRRLWWQMNGSLQRYCSDFIVRIQMDNTLYSDWYGPNVLRKMVSNFPDRYVSKQRDVMYWSFKNTQDAFDAVESLLTPFYTYTPDGWDCDDFALYLKVMLNAVYGVNNCAFVESEWNDGSGMKAHAWNMLWTPEGAIKIDGESDRIWNFGDKAPIEYQSMNIREHIL